ncbi:hypothetical protein IMG5_090940 [Ichthyophthirius multifiliis]|uniref:Uncharacterized protein n=1 Tax=Ichthyophthirius multifiliis TaxID=5932 RepID=G0QR93_ICHMU|nr:hypothetical protein IMG5_090940 [Ichthyophthirius multifiliis]EGR32245.1 hypothetical protein IMG5_090940 [Ichthyophthirius multifiliis]|eukprot:XP_004035731.1 hypothetical protein IMG5_090940 [Ichthyophthirius multifiliis]
MIQERITAPEEIIFRKIINYYLQLQMQEYIYLQIIIIQIYYLEQQIFWRNIVFQQLIKNSISKKCRLYQSIFFRLG